MWLDRTDHDVDTLVHKIKNHHLDLQPNFQRGSVWSEPKKKRLVDTILRNWYVPPIHVVVNDVAEKEEILDGQQRLRAIYDFYNDKFAVDGTLEPWDQNIQKLDGFYFSDLPSKFKSIFLRFTITTVRLRHYEPSEPGELFFRLSGRHERFRAALQALARTCPAYPC